jgi:Pyruvate/2-oxoacid:ferredoxin oxidoreductase delta subunit
MTKRLIVQIDEGRCDGCGLCVPSCAEGAIQIREGKARLVSDVYCDGLGACLAECPRGAITIVEREADAFDEEAARRHAGRAISPLSPGGRGVGGEGAVPRSSCPGTAVQNFKPTALPILGSAAGPTALSGPDAGAPGEPSALAQWPIQLRLVPPDAPFLTDADLLLVADCVPFALADFHRSLLKGRPIVIGCPKLDDQAFYVGKLTEMLRRSTIRSLSVIHMEVPCCTGLVRIAAAALEASGKQIPLEDIVVSIRGQILGRQPRA